MNTPTNHAVCGRCATIIPPDAITCPACGAAIPFKSSLEMASITAASAASPNRSHASWSAALNNRCALVCTLFFVTAALGLPLLWMSRAFSRSAKVWLSIIVTLYTVFILWLFWLVMVWCVATIREALV